MFFYTFNLILDLPGIKDHFQKDDVFVSQFSQFFIKNLFVFKYLPRLAAFAGGYEICHTNFTST
jgi:hypothetical protein